MGKRSILNSVSESVTGFFHKKKAGQSAVSELSSAVKSPYGAFQFEINVKAGTEYEIMASTNLRSWTTLVNEKAAASRVQFVDSEATKFSFRFYRVSTEGIASKSVIGYACVTLPPGFSMIANPFLAPDNSIGKLFAGMPEGTTFNKFDTLEFRLTTNAIKNGKWSDPRESLVSSEGALIFNPTNDSKVLAFAGQVMQGKVATPIPAGFSIRSSFVPLPGRLHLDLGFPATAGDVIHLFDRDQQKYLIFPYDEEKWATNPPTIGVGESFWVGKSLPANWVQEFRLDS